MPEISAGSATSPLPMVSIGDVLRDQGNLAGALDSYRASHAIRERLAVADLIDNALADQPATSRAFSARISDAIARRLAIASAV
jgi:hypothetical protein